MSLTQTLEIYLNLTVLSQPLKFMNSIKFDPAQFDRIKNLILLKGECLELSKLHMENYTSIDKYSNFYSSMSDVIDILLTSQINDELTNASNNNRYPLVPLFQNILSTLQTAESRKLFQSAHDDLENLFKWRTDFLNGSHFLDFTVSSYSVFEYWTSKIYNELFDATAYRKKKIKLALTHIKKIQAIENQVEKEKQLEKALSECSFYISGAQKIQQVIKMAKQKNPNINNLDMLQKITFYGSLRNTIHNLGKHEGTSSKTLLNIELNHGKPTYSIDFSNHTKLCREIIYIYKEIIESLDISSSNICIDENFV